MALLSFDCCFVRGSGVRCIAIAYRISTTTHDTFHFLFQKVNHRYKFHQSDYLLCDFGDFSVDVSVSFSSIIVDLISQQDCVSHRNEN